MLTTQGSTLAEEAAMRSPYSWHALRRASIVLAATGVIAILGMAAPSGASPATKGSGQGAVINVLWSSQYGPVLVTTLTTPTTGASIPGIPLYEISSDTRTSLGCTTAPVEPTYEGTITCTGPESDFINGAASDEWPAFTTTGPIVAGHGVNRFLLGTIYRPGVGRQVTYNGHPLYLFDGPSTPFSPAGEGFLETVLPLPPWHGLWDVVSATNGNPAPGNATIETGTLPDTATVLSVEEYNNVVPGGAAITVYAFGHGRAPTRCPASCAANWIPVLTQGRPQAIDGVPQSRLGVVPTGEGLQVTYDGKPLYIYAQEQALFATGFPQTTGTAGNGAGLPGPGGNASTISL